MHEMLLIILLIITVYSFIVKYHERDSIFQTVLLHESAVLWVSQLPQNLRTDKGKVIPLHLALLLIGILLVMVKTV